MAATWNLNCGFKSLVIIAKKTSLLLIVSRYVIIPEAIISLKNQNIASFLFRFARGYFVFLHLMHDGCVQFFLYLGFHC